LSESTALVKVSVILFAVKALTSALSFVAAPITAAIFGTQGEYEAYIVSSSIPTLITNLMMLGAINIVFIPIFTEFKTKHGDDEAWHFANALNTLYVLGIGVVMVVGVLLAPYLVAASAPGMETAYKELGTSITRVLFGGLVFAAVQGIYVGILQSNKIFILPSVYQLIVSVINVGMIIVVRDRIGVWILVIAGLLSAVTGLMMNAITYRELLVKRIRLVWDIHHPGIRKASFMLFSMSFIMIANQVNLMSNRFFASFLGTGAIATMEYASKLIPLILSLFVGSIVVPLYAHLSTAAARNDINEVRAFFSLGIRMTGIVLLPVTSLFVFLRVPIFRLIYEHGRFTSQDTLNVSSVFLVLSVALILWGFAQTIVNTFYAMQRPKVMVFVTVTGVLLNIALDALLIGPLKLPGLALASGIGAIYGALVSLWFLREMLYGLDGSRLAIFLAKVSVAAMVAGVAGWFLAEKIGESNPIGIIPQIIQVSSAMSVGMIIYLILLILLKVKEVNLISSHMVERLPLLVAKLIR